MKTVEPNEMSGDAYDPVIKIFPFPVTAIPLQKSEIVPPALFAQMIFPSESNLARKISLDPLVLLVMDIGPNAREADEKDPAIQTL